MVTAFVLINVQDETMSDIAGELLTFDGVKEVHVVAGEYDMVAVVRVKENSALSDLITQKVIHVAGVERTKTLFALQSYSHLDLGAVYDLA
mgnify:CR=1 FL=1